MAIAMLPVGGTMLVVSALAAIAVAALAVDLLVHDRLGWDRLGWALAWCVAALAVALHNMRAGIAMMSAFDWRPLPLSLLLSAAMIAAWLALP